MSRSWWLGVAAASTVIFALPASAQQPPLPGTPSVPSVTVPTETVPPVTVPQVTVPPTPVTPPAQTPSVTTPSVTTPSVTTPSVPPSGGSTGAGTASGAGTSGQTGAAGDGGSSTGSANGSGAAGSSAPSSAGSGSSTGSGSANGAGGGHPRSADRTGAPDRSRDMRRDRALRHAVLASEACLGQMPRSERRVLTLRAGVGIGRPRTRAQVERITGLRKARVAALERSGLQRLRSLSRAGCSSASSEATGRGTATPAAQPPSAAGPSQITVRGQRRSSTGPAPSDPKPDRARSGGLPLLHTPDSALDLVPFAIAFGLAAGIFVFVREARRSA